MLKKIVLGLLAAVIFLGGFLWWLGGQDNEPLVIRRYGEEEKQLAEEKARTATLVANAARQKTAPLLTPEEIKYEPSFRYQLKDLLVAKNVGPDALWAYQTAVEKIIADYNLTNIKNDLAVFMTAFENEDGQAAAKLKTATVDHLQIARALAAIEVPSGATAMHLNLTNSILALAEINYHLADVLKEPAVALQSAEIYPARYGNVLQNIAAVNQYFAALNLLKKKS